MVEDKHQDVKRIYREPGDAIEGDAILLYCRKPQKWEKKVRAAKGHHYFMTEGKKNALAVLKRTFKNLQK